MITDVTRMQGDKVCIAALDKGKAVRLHNPVPKEEWLRLIGGLAPGDVVSLSWKSPRRYQRPYLEDRDWNPESLSKVEHVAEDELAQRLSDSAFLSIKDAFGQPCFHSENGNAAFAVGKGARSLASVGVDSVRVYPHEEGVRVDFADRRQEWSMVPLEDLAVRNHRAHCSACSTSLPTSLASEFEGGPAILRVGVGRPFQSGGYPPACWMQVNHIFLIPSRRNHFV